jgi:hypothetical protein
MLRSSWGHFDVIVGKHVRVVLFVERYFTKLFDFMVDFTELCYLMVDLVLAAQ